MPSNWPSSPVPPLLILLSSILYALLLLAFPPRPLSHRILLFALFCLPASYAFTYHQHLTPWFGINDTLGRLVYIWGVHVSEAVLVVGARPVGCEGDEIGTERARDRMRWAGKMLFARRLGGYYPRWVAGREEKEKEREKEGERCGNSTGKERRRTRGDPPHNLSTCQFACHHAVRLLLCHAVDYAWDAYIATPSILSSPLKSRFLMAWDTCISDALYFTTHYSFVALLCVPVLRLDTPSEWSLSVFGSLADCWSVRRYWGVYWHDYIGASFSAHAKLFTRRVLGWKRPSAARRAVENALVFAASGLGHAAVRYVQTEGRGEVWTVAIWYAAQMLPIVVEGGVGSVWGRSGVRGEVRELVGLEVLGRVERAVGYMWVFAWMLWSVPMYLLTREKWEMEGFRRNHPEMFGWGLEGVNAAV
ncbi:toxin biosynthesis protein [Stagonosporopsis vannaccii]|nr:toxin biosynthesis protein [Stagonosporopsis vannaccii]